MRSSALTAPPALISIPLLQDGDTLSHEEFERRYDAMPDLKKAELLNGVVNMGSPVRIDQHGEQHVILLAWIAAFRFSQPYFRAADNSTVRLDPLNEPQPDAALLVLPEFGGQAGVGPEGYIEGPPELVAEVSASTRSIDLKTKLEIYCKSGIKEYLVWRVLDQAIDWFVLREEKYERLLADEQGIYRSEVFPGLWLDSAALIQFDLAKVLATLQQGITSPEHRQFIEKIALKAK